MEGQENYTLVLTKNENASIEVGGVQIGYTGTKFSCGRSFMTREWSCIRHCPMISKEAHCSQ